MASEDVTRMILQARQERAQKEYTERWQELQNEYRSNCEARNQASYNGDRPDWDYWDSLCEQNERDLQAFYPVQQPVADPRAVNWDHRNRAFIERLEQRLGRPAALQKLAELDGYLTRPRNPRATNPNQHGCGLERNSPAYFKRAEDLLELYSASHAGVTYDPSERALSADEAAKISGLSPRHYNRSVQTLMAQGRLGQDDK